MPMPTGIASPHRVRVDRMCPQPWRRAAAARVMHVGRSYAVLDDLLSGLVVLSGTAAGLVPGGIQLTDAGLAQLLRALPDGRVDLTAWTPKTVVAADLVIRRSRVSVAAVERYRSALRSAPRRQGPMDPRAVRSLAVGLADGARRGDDSGPALTRLIGAGPGSTPSGDDVTIGVLAGLRAVGETTAALTIGAALRPMLSRTTRMSAHALAAAADGRFADRVHDLVTGLAAPDRATRVVRRAASWGATSGHDLVAGLVEGVVVPSRSRLSA